MTKKTKETKAPATELPVMSQQGRKVGAYQLDPSIFDGKVNTALMHQYVVAYLANQRQGNASTKTRAQVSGSGKKPWRQKGTGRARVGSIRSPLWIHGGVIHGPKPRKYTQFMPKKMKTLAFLSSLNDKVRGDAFIVLDELSFPEPKTKAVAALFAALKAEGKNLIVVDAADANLMRASRNLPKCTVLNGADCNAYAVLTHDRLLVTRKALALLEKKLKERK